MIVAVLFLTVPHMFQSWDRTSTLGVVVCTKAPSNEHFPEFGQVAVIFVPEESKLLLINKFNTNFYSS